MKAKPYNPEYLDKAIEECEAIYLHRIEHPKEKADEVYYKLFLKYLRSVRTAKEEGKFLVAHFAHPPDEILQAMDIVTCVLVAIGTAVSRYSKRYSDVFDSVAKYGVNGELCSPLRFALGQVLAGHVPYPDLVLSTTHHCDNESKSGEAVAYAVGCPVYYLDRPSTYSERNVQYYAEQLGLFIEYLEGRTGRKMDWNRLGQTIETMQKQLLLRREVFKLRDAKPGPMRNRRVANTFPLDQFYNGTPEAVEYYTVLRDELKAKVERGESFSGEERLRLYPFFFAPTWAWRLWDWMENTAHAACLGGPDAQAEDTPEWFISSMDPSKPLETMAREAFLGNRAVRISVFSEEQKKKEEVANCIRETAIDGVLWYHNVGCTFFGGTYRSKIDLFEGAGAPVLFLEQDYTNESLSPNSAQDLEDKTKAFCEMLEARKKGESGT